MLLAQQHTQRVISECDVLRHELHVLQEGIATLKATTDLDARINALLIADQSEEIEQLRVKLSASDSRCDSLTEAMRHLSADIHHSRVKSAAKTPFDVSKLINNVATSTATCTNSESIAKDMSFSTVHSADATKSSDDFKPVIAAKETSSVSNVAQRISQRSPMKREQLLTLQKRRDSLFKEYERRHSTTIDNVVRRNSQLFATTPSTQASQNGHSPHSQSAMSGSPPLLSIAKSPLARPPKPTSQAVHLL